MCFLAAVLSAGAQAELPQAEYSCQVVTEGGAPGLVELQIESRESAMAVAGKLQATTVTWGRDRAAEVIQCIRRPHERFKDPGFQTFYENVPR